MIIHGRDREEHDHNLKAFLERCKDNGIKLNRDNLKLRMSEVTFMGHLITKDGLQSDPEKVKAIAEMAAPTNINELRRYLGVINYLAKFLPHMTDVIYPLRNLTKDDIKWTWTESQQQAFETVRSMLTNAPVLAFYDPKKELRLENDASEYGLGSALMQEGKPVAYASKTLTETEKSYAQLEKEMLAVTFGLEKFHHYTFGRQVHVMTDHKALMAIAKKPLSKAPKRLQNLLLRAQRYTYDLTWIPGKEIPLADALSRAPVQKATEEEVIHNVTVHRIKDEHLQQVRNATATDSTLVKLGEIILKGWPDHRADTDVELLPYYNYRDELTIQDGIIYRGERIVIPRSLRQEMKSKIHAGHLGINSCLRGARDLLYWPGMSAEIRQHVETCGTCATYASKQAKETPVISAIPDRPWKKGATDMLSWAGDEYFVTVDYHGGYFELDKLTYITSGAVIQKLKEHFSRHGTIKPCGSWHRIDVSTTDKRYDRSETEHCVAFTVRNEVPKAMTLNEFEIATANDRVLQAVMFCMVSGRWHQPPSDVSIAELSR